MEGDVGVEVGEAVRKKGKEKRKERKKKPFEVGRIELSLVALDDLTPGRYR